MIMCVIFFIFFTLFHFTMFTKVTTDYLILWKQTDKEQPLDKEQPNLPSDEYLSVEACAEIFTLRQSLDTTWEV